MQCPFLCWKEFMFSLRTIVSSALSTTFLVTGLVAGAQTIEIQKTLEKKYNLTKATADRSDIVTAGDVVVLQKDGLLMCAVTSGTPTTNNYKNGKISQNILNKRFGFASVLGAAGNNAPTRTFVSGEKFWITSIETKDDGVVFGLISDPINDTRFYSTLKIQFATKGQPPSAAEMATLADQVFKVDGGGGGGNAPAAAPAAAVAPPPPPMAAIPPPPPPPDAAAVPPPTIKLGESKADVTNAFGQPTKVVKLATKEIDYYPDMKVTFVHDKVTDIQ
jgi:hypothetical protein